MTARGVVTPRRCIGCGGSGRSGRQPCRVCEGRGSLLTLEPAPTPTPTIAQSIAAQFSNDGQCFETEDGVTIEDVVAEWALFEDYRDGRGTDTVRYSFADDSVLTIAGDCWDLGYLDCFCSQGAGHDESCEAGDGHPCDWRSAGLIARGAA